MASNTHFRLVLSVVLWHAIGVLSAGNSFAQQNYKPQPLPIKSDGLTQLKYTEELHAYYERYVQQYEKNTKDPADVRDEAKDFIRETTRWLLRAQQTLEEKTALAGRGEKLLADGSQDPLVKLLVVTVSEMNNKSTQAALHKYLDGATSNLDKSGYDAMTRAFILTRNHTLRSAIGGKDSEQVKKLVNLNLVYATIEEWIQDEKDHLDVQRYLWHTLSGYSKYIGKSGMKTLSDAVQAKQIGHPWMQLMIQARYLIKVAEDFLPDRFAASPEGLRNAFADAANILRSAHQLEPRFPEPAVEMIDIARHKVIDDSPRYWFDQAVKAQFDYAPAYTYYRMVMRFPQDKTFSQLLAFGVECANTKRYDTAVPFELFESILACEQILGREFDVWSKPGVYDALSKMIIGAAQAPTFNGVPQTAETKQWLAAVLLGVSLRAGQFEKAETLWNRPTKADINRAFRMCGLTDAMSVLRAKSSTQAAKVPIADLEKVMNTISSTADINKARLELKRQRAKLPKTGDPGWFDYWDVRLNVLAAYLADKPATIEFTPALASYLTNSEWDFVDKNSVRAHSVYQLELPLPQEYGPYEVSFGLTMKKPPKEPKLLLGALMGTERNGNPMFGRPFGISAEGVASVNTVSGQSAYMAKVREENQLRIRVWESFAEFFVNDELVFCNQCFGFEPNGRVQLISPNERGEKVGDIVYHHIQVRRLNEPVPPHEVPERVKYFTAQLKKKDDPRMRRWRGSDLLLLGKYQEAADDFAAYLVTDDHDYYGRQIAARAFHNVEKYAEELKVLQELVKLIPLSQYANSELAWFLATCPDEKIRDTQAGLKQAELTEEIYEGKTETAQYALAAVAIENKDYKKAESLIKVYANSKREGTEEFRHKLLREAIDQKSVVRDTSKVRSARYTHDWDTPGMNRLLRKKP
jgi:hypothetical protein